MATRLMCSEEYPTLRRTIVGLKLVSQSKGMNCNRKMYLFCWVVVPSTGAEELDLYTKERPVSRKVNPFDWWKANSVNYPKLAVVAGCFLCSPATSVPAERLFSTVGGTVGCASDWRPGGRGFDTRRGPQHSFVEIDHEIFSTVILSLPLIQEGQLSVSGERMCTILVNRIENYACPVNVWLGKLTALDMTPLG